MRVSAELGTLIEALTAAAHLPGGTVKHARAKKPRWERFTALAQEHQLSPFLASRVLMSRPNANVRSVFPRWVEEGLLKSYARSGHDAAFRNTELVRILDMLDGTASPVVLKGAAIVHTLYGEGAERQMSDFDLLLPTPQSLAQTRALLVREGYRVSRSLALSQTPAGHHHDVPLGNPIAEQTFELHTNLATPGLSTSAIVEIWRQRVQLEVGGCRNFFALDPVSALMHHALHAMADPIDSPLLRNLFEVAWMASQLGRADRATLRSLATRWGLGPRLGVSLHLAARLFGSPPIVAAPARFDARAMWGLARLEWTGSFEEDRSTWERLRRHLASLHLAAIARGARASSPIPLFRAIAESVGAAMRSRLEGLERRGRARRLRVEPTPIPAAVVGGCLLAHDLETGNVHLVDRLSTEVWAQTKLSSEPEEIEALLSDAGVDRPTVRAALQKLLASGLIRRSSVPV